MTETKENIIIWYQSHGGRIQDLDQLVYQARNLSILLYWEAVKMGKTTSAYYIAEATHEINNAISEVSHAHLGATKARAKAKTDTVTQRSAEALAKGKMKVSEIEHRAASNVLNRMNQEISYLKDEKNREFRTGLIEQLFGEKLQFIERKIKDLEAKNLAA